MSSVLSRSLVTHGAVLAAASTLLAGCGFSGLYDLPLPGGADLGDHPLTVHAELANVYDLVPQASVKLNDVTVGKVGKIKLGHAPDGKWMADVTLDINGDTVLPSNTTAELRQTSLLGEKFVELAVPPQNQWQGRLASGATVSEDDSYHHVEIEEVLGALSLLLNNGGLEQIQQISRELENATSGNESDIRSTLDNVNTFTAGLDAHSADITRALDGLNRLSATLNDQKAQLVNVVDNIGPGLRSLDEQRGQLVGMLRALQNLSGVTIDTVHKTQDELIADLKALRPTLHQLAASGTDVSKSLSLLVTPPFTDYAATTFKGDYANLFATLDLNAGTLIDNLSNSPQSLLNSLGPTPLTGVLGGTSGGSSTGRTPSPNQDTAPPQPSTGGGTPSSGGLADLLGLLSGGGA